MNTHIKHSMQLGLLALLIGAVTVPVCAQSKLGKAAKDLTKRTHKGNVIKPGVQRHEVRIPGSTAKRYIPTASTALPRLSPEAERGLIIDIAPARIAPSDGQLLFGLERQATRIRLEDATPVQLANAAYHWATNNSDKRLAENLVLYEKIEALLGEEKPDLDLVPMLPLLNTLKYGRKPQSFTQFAAKYPKYPNTIELDKYGFPEKNTLNNRLEPYLLAADPVQMGAFVMNPTLLESAEVSRSGLALRETERAAAEALIERRLERLANISAENASPREVLQVAYNYFATQQKLTTGDLYKMNFEYRYRADLPFEQLTAAEKEGFIVHKLIRQQLAKFEKMKKSFDLSEEYQLKIIDMNHLQLLDYVASKNANGLLRTVDGGYYNTVDGISKVFKAYKVLDDASWMSFVRGRQLLEHDVAKRARKLFEYEYKQISSFK